MITDGSCLFMILIYTIKFITGGDIIKLVKVYNSINIIFAILCIVLFISILILTEQKVLLGVIFRGAISLLMIFNSIYLLFSDLPSFLAQNVDKKRRIICGIALLIVGLFGFVTAILGYGINGYPLLDWGTVF